MAKYLSHAYGNVMNAISKAWRKHKRLVSILNWFDRNVDKIYRPMKADESAVEYINDLFNKRIDGNDKDARLKAYGSIRMVRYLCSFNMIGLWNPKGNKIGLLGKKEVAKLQLHEETDGEKGGITPFRLGQIAYALGTRYAKKHGEAYTIPTEELDGKKAVEKFHKELVSIAKAYHAKANRKWEAKQNETEQDNGLDHAEEPGQVTVDDILDGVVELKNVNEVDLLNEAYELCENGGKKGAITRRLKAIEA